MKRTETKKRQNNKSIYIIIKCTLYMHIKCVYKYTVHLQGFSDMWRAMWNMQKAAETKIRIDISYEDKTEY